MTTAVLQRRLLALPSDFSGETALADSAALLTGDPALVVDASGLQAVDSVGGATLGLFRERARVAGEDPGLIPPHGARPRALVAALLGGRPIGALDGEGRHVVMPASAIANRQGLRAASARVREQLEPPFGRVVNIAQITVATLVDNALRHGGGAESPVLAVVMVDGMLEVCVRDLGGEIAACADRRLELVRRIQVPAQMHDATPGSPVGIAWLATLIERRRLAATLAFAAGDGRLTFSGGRWSCHRGAITPGFAAIACLPLV